MATPSSIAAVILGGGRSGVQNEGKEESKATVTVVPEAGHRLASAVAGSSNVTQNIGNLEHIREFQGGKYDSWTPEVIKDLLETCKQTC